MILIDVLFITRQFMILIDVLFITRQFSYHAAVYDSY